MKLYNTLSRTIEEFTPQAQNLQDPADQQPSKPVVTFYSCGPTVYNYYHIGNLRNAVFNDTLRRTLEAAGYNVHHVMNITDVGHLVSDEDEGEDKLERGAAREGKTVWDVAAHYTEAFKRDMHALNILPPSVNPHRAKNQEGSAVTDANPTGQEDPYARATDFVPEQLDMVVRLIKNKSAYLTDQAVYFDVTKLSDYGKLSGQSLADKEIAARPDIVTDPGKRSPHDFAVWFFCVGHFADHTMRWSSQPIAKALAAPHTDDATRELPDGFPGWHLECSAIIHATLDGHSAGQPGRPIDIHTGGVDHIGTHHPNEMAQTQGAFGHDLARFWVHNEFILVDGAKMSKSKGNSYTLADITSRKDSQGRPFHPLSLRLLYLQAHYRSEINFTWESLEAAQNRLINLYAWADEIHQKTDKMPIHNSFTLLASNDLNTPEILSLINTDEGAPTQDYLAHLDALLGLGLAGRPDITDAQKSLIADWRTAYDEAKQTKDFSKPDAIRAQLRDEHHLALDITPHGSRWRRTALTV